MRLLNSCCFCCSLTRGTVVIAVLSLIGAPCLLIKDVLSYINGGSDIATFAISTISKISLIVATVFLLVSVSKKNPVYTLPWLVLNAIGIIVTPIYSIYIVVIYVNLGLTLEMSIFIGIIIPMLALNIYFWLVVFSYYKELKSTAKSIPAEIPAIPAKENA